MTSPSSTPDKNNVRVMLVDDSAVVRGLLTRVLTEDPHIQVIAAAENGQRALDLLKNHDPDIVILDIEMPVMDGITALPLILRAKPGIKVMMCSTLSVRNADITLKALSLGAVDTIAKPTAAGNILGSAEFKSDLIRMVKNIGQARKIMARAAPSPSRALPAIEATPKINSTFKLRPLTGMLPARPDILAIGSSTGGPQALFTVLADLKNLPVPIVITQHMPPTFTAMLATHITQNTGIPAHEGAEGQVLEPGHAYVAPGGRHMTIIRPDGGKPSIHLTDSPPENFCRPAVDPMFRSLAEVYGGHVLAVILTGMGYDGLKGSEVLVNKGARLIAQDEATSVVWGMPGAVASANLCHAVLPLPELGINIRRIFTLG